MYTYQGTEQKRGYEPGKQYDMTTQNFTGRIYASRDDIDGKPDTRIMAWRNGSGNEDAGLLNYDSVEEFRKEFRPGY